MAGKKQQPYTSKLKGVDLLLGTTTEANSNLSLKEIKERIKQLQPKPEESNSPKQRVNNLVKGLNKSKLWEKEPKKWQKVSKLIEKIESFLEE